MSNQQQSTKIILVRHGRSTYNEEGRYQGSSNESVLTEQGRKTAYLTGLALQNFQFDAIYSSPLKRVQQTTEEIVKALHNFQDNLKPVQSDRRLTEVNMATWEGLAYAYVKKYLAQDYHCWQNTPHLFAFPSVENSEAKFYPLQDLYQRAKSFLTDILNQHRGQTILIVAHGGTNRALISSAIGLAPDKYHSLQQSNCGISYLEFKNARSLLAQLKWLNVTNHLNENLPKLKAGKTGLRWLLVSNKTAENIQLTQYLASKTIDLIVSDRYKNSQQLAKIYQEQFSQAIHLSFTNQKFLVFWQKYLVDKSYNSSDLITGLIIIDESLLQDFFKQLFPLKLNLNLNQSYSVIHYPQKNHIPILQGLLPTQNMKPFIFNPINFK